MITFAIVRYVHIETLLSMHQPCFVNVLFVWSEEPSSLVSIMRSNIMRVDRCDVRNKTFGYEKRS